MSKELLVRIVNATNVLLIFLSLKIIDPETDIDVHIGEENFDDATQSVDWIPDYNTLKNATEIGAPERKNEPKTDEISPNNSELPLDPRVSRLRVKIIGILGMLTAGSKYVFITYTLNISI